MDKMLNADRFRTPFRQICYPLILMYSFKIDYSV